MDCADGFAEDFGYFHSSACTYPVLAFQVLFFFVLAESLVVAFFFVRLLRTAVGEARALLIAVSAGQVAVVCVCASLYAQGGFFEASIFFFACALSSAFICGRCMLRIALNPAMRLGSVGQSQLAFTFRASEFIHGSSIIVFWMMFIALMAMCRDMDLFNRYLASMLLFWGAVHAPLYVGFVVYRLWKLEGTIRDSVKGAMGRQSLSGKLLKIADKLWLLQRHIVGFAILLCFILLGAATVFFALGYFPYSWVLSFCTILNSLAGVLVIYVFVRQSSVAAAPQPSGFGSTLVTDPALASAAAATSAA